MPHAGELDEAGRVVARPAVDEQAGIVAVGDLGGGDRRLPRVHGDVAALQPAARSSPARSMPSATPSARPGRPARQRSIVSSRNDEISQRPSPRSARSASTSTATRSSGSKSGSWRLVLDLDVRPTRPRRRRARHRASGTCAGSSRHGVATITRPSGSAASWCTTSTPSSGPPDVQLDAVGADLDGTAECQRSCSPAPGATPHGGQ